MYSCGVLVLIYLSSVSSLVVNTTTGSLEGLLVHDEDASYFAYLGIPYAEPPVGPLRFKPPQPKKPWSGIYNATKYGPVCPQSGNYNRDEMSEDCLYLNVYVPSERRQQNELMPVLVFVHGGGFESLSGDDKIIYGPQFLMKYGIIVVTMNFRLGALGFLSSQSEEAPGNAGIKDVVQSLSWVRDTIAAFGGRRDAVTLAGQSAGAALAHYVMLSPQSEGLFQRIYLSSSSAIGYRFLDKHPIDNALALGAQLGYHTGNADNLVRYLRTLDAFDILDAQRRMSPSNNITKVLRQYAPFVPVVEPASRHAIITDTPRRVINQGIPQVVPVLAGFNTEEGLKIFPEVTKNSNNLPYLNDHLELLLPTDIEYPYGSAKSLNLANAIRRLYLNGQELNESLVYGLVYEVMDTQYVFGIDYWIQKYKSMHNNTSVYYYSINFDGDLNWAKLKYGVNMAGTEHGDDLGYIFLTNATRPLINNIDKRTKKTMEILLTLITNFVKDGVPSADGIQWHDCGERRDYLLLNDMPQMITGPPLKRRLNFWRNVYDDYESYVENGGLTEQKLS